MKKETIDHKSKLFVWNGLAFFYSTEHTNDFHTHCAASLLHSMGAPLSIEYKGKQELYNSVFLPPNFEHKLVSSHLFFVIQIDPNLLTHYPALQKNAQSPQKLEGFEEINFPQKLEKIKTCDHAYQFVKEFLKNWEPKVPEKKKIGLDPRINRSIEYLYSLEEIPSQIFISSLAEKVGLSSDRFRHIFKDELGLSFRRFVLWLRIRKMGSSLKRGFSLTHASHAAGFTDSAHFSKVFKENFGVSPSKLLLNPDLSLNFCDNFLDRPAPF